MKYRCENFGGIVASEDPPFLAYVDENFMRDLGVHESALWDNKEKSIELLSAPTEVHFSLTNRCTIGCSHCYMNSQNSDDGEMDTATAKKALDALAEAGVFHVAMGGGDSLMRDDLIELAHHARKVGMVPNLTISGAFMTPLKAREMKVFGQVNLSVDAVGPHNYGFRPKDAFNLAHSAISMLVEAGVPTGINCVLGNVNFDVLPEIFAYANKKGVNEIEILRIKPVGRGGTWYEKERTSYGQNTRLIPLLSMLSKANGITAKIDCSFVPMLCWHKPPVEYLTATATYGCEAGNVLLGAGSDGSVSGCSFLPETDLTLFDFHQNWTADPQLNALRHWSLTAPEPCRSCTYLDICKGGCRAVALYCTGSMLQPDPDCPMVHDYNLQVKDNEA